MKEKLELIQRRVRGLWGKGFATSTLSELMQEVKYFTLDDIDQAITRLAETSTKWRPKPVIVIQEMKKVRAARHQGEIDAGVRYECGVCSGSGFVEFFGTRIAEEDEPGKPVAKWSVGRVRPPFVLSEGLAFCSCAAGRVQQERMAGYRRWARRSFHHAPESFDRGPYTWRVELLKSGKTYMEAYHEAHVEAKANRRKMG